MELKCLTQLFLWTLPTVNFELHFVLHFNVKTPIYNHYHNVPAANDEKGVDDEVSGPSWVPSTREEESSEAEAKQQQGRILSRCWETCGGLERATVLIHLVTLPHMHKSLLCGAFFF